MLTSNNETKNTNNEIDVDIKISSYQSIHVNINNESGYLTDVRQINKITGNSEPLINLRIDGEFNQPIILPDSITTLYIDGKFNQPIILPNQIKNLFIKGEFNQPIILPDSITTLSINGIFNQPIILPNQIKIFLFIKNSINQLYYHIV